MSTQVKDAVRQIKYTRKRNNIVDFYYSYNEYKYSTNIQLIEILIL